MERKRDSVKILLNTSIINIWLSVLYFHITSSRCAAINFLRRRNFLQDERETMPVKFSFSWLRPRSWRDGGSEVRRPSALSWQLKAAEIIRIRPSRWWISRWAPFYSTCNAGSTRWGWFKVREMPRRGDRREEWTPALIGPSIRLSLQGLLVESWVAPVVYVARGWRGWTTSGTARRCLWSARTRVSLWYIAPRNAFFHLNRPNSFRWKLCVVHPLLDLLVSLDFSGLWRFFVREDISHAIINAKCN